MSLTENWKDDTNVYEVREDTDDGTGEKGPRTPDPPFRIYRGSKIAVGKAVGQGWKNRLDAALAAYEYIYMVWNEVFQYYNNDQNKQMTTPKGVFKRGDGTENLVYSNLNIVLPAVYSRNPTITCTATEREEEGFCKCLETVLNVLFRRKDRLGAKAKVRRATGFGLLTNQGVLKLEWTRKDESREIAQQEINRILEQMMKVRDEQDLERLYGQLEALEEGMETREPSGPKLSVLLPQNLIIDPMAEQQDGLDADWMMEHVFLSTAMLNERFTEPDPAEDEEDEEGKSSKERARVLVFKPTHKAVFNQSSGNQRDDGLGVVLQAIEGNQQVTEHTLEERIAFQQMWFTECYYVWDKTTQRVYLFAADDWTWPIWVWQSKDQINISQFFPFFLIGFGMSTGGTTSVGEMAFVLDQQDEINDVNRQISRIRRSVFDFFVYNSRKIEPGEAEKFVDALRGISQSPKHLLGVDAGESKISDLIEAVKPPSVEYEALFAKDPIKDAFNRITNTSDALRGTQFKSYTNESAIETYQESLRLSIGAKVDVIEDAIADLAYALAELCLQNMDMQEVSDMVGQNMAKEWKNMTPEIFARGYDLQIVGGSTEKPNSVFKKKEAVEIAQAVGQFAQAAPGASLMIILDLFSKAFTDIVIKPEHWKLLQAEVQASMQKGTAAQGGGQGDPAAQQMAQQQAMGEQDQQRGQVEAMFRALNPQQKRMVMRMRAKGVSPDRIIGYVQQVFEQAQQGQQRQQQVADRTQGRREQLEDAAVARRQQLSDEEFARGQDLEDQMMQLRTQATANPAA